MHRAFTHSKRRHCPCLHVTNHENTLNSASILHDNERKTDKNPNGDFIIHKANEKQLPPGDKNPTSIMFYCDTRTARSITNCPVTRRNDNDSNHRVARRNFNPPSFPLSPSKRRLKFLSPPCLRNPNFLSNQPPITPSLHHHPHPPPL